MTDARATKVRKLPPLKVEKGADGVTALKTVGEVLSNHSDVYAAQCKL
jgi:branched-chain amino acid transport system substrate-binding protein